MTAIGIDFGTTNSSIAVSDGHDARLLPLDPANRTPEVVKTILYITRDHEMTIGEDAVQTYYRQNVGRPRHFVKKWVGEIEFRASEVFYVRDVFAYVDELQPGRLLQYIKTALRSDGYEGTLVFDRFYSVRELITHYLRILKARAEAHMGEELRRVVFGRPVYFSEDAEIDAASEQALWDAGRAAGFDEIAFELEPVAAALSYEAGTDRPQNIVVFDFGGGTLDITVMRVGGGERAIFATGGVDIAGSNFDKAIIRAKLFNHFGYGTTYGRQRYPFPKRMVEQIADWQTLASLGTLQNRNELDRILATSSNPCRVENLISLIFNDYGFDLYRRVEDAKIALSSGCCAEIALEDEGIAVWQMLTRLQFERIIAPYVEQVQERLTETVRASGLKPDEIDGVVATGGSSGIPRFQEMLRDVFGPEKVSTMNLFSSVAAGLGIRAHEIFGG